jgi:enamine deaminase RidA (YjgF/YER057c/UK114 family)
MVPGDQRRPSEAGGETRSWCMGKELVSGEHIAKQMGKPIGPYSHGVITSGRMLWIAGQIGWDADGKIVGKGDFEAQYRQVMRNIEAVVLDAGGEMRNVCKVVNYVTFRMMPEDESYAQLSAVRREFIPGDFPAISTLVEVTSLMDDDALVETDAVCVLG